jgi:WD40 repeat protein
MLYSSGYINLWKPGKEGQVNSYSVNRGGFQELIFTPDSKRLIFLSRVGTIQIWNTGTGELEGNIYLPGAMTSVAISPSSKILAIGLENGTIQLWNFNTRSLQLTTKKHYVPFYTLAFSPDEKVLVSGNSTAGDVFYWNTEDGALITSYTNFIDASISVSPNGSLLMICEHDYTTGTNTTHFYDTETTQEVFSLDNPNGFIFSNDGTKLLTYFQRQKVYGIYSLEIWGITP